MTAEDGKSRRGRSDAFSTSRRLDQKRDGLWKDTVGAMERVGFGGK